MNLVRFPIMLNKRGLMIQIVMIIVTANCYRQSSIVTNNIVIIKLITNLSPCWMCCMCTSTQSWNTFRMIDQFQTGAGVVRFLNRLQ